MNRRPYRWGNKRPKGPHIVHLSTMCHLFDRLARAAILFFQSAKTQTWKRTLRSFFLSSFVAGRSAVSEERSKMSQPIRGQGGHLVFLIRPKNTNLVEDVEILLPVKFRWIPFSGFRGEVENVSANQRPGRPSCFSDWPKKHKLSRGLELRACFLSSFIEFRLAVSEEKSKMWKVNDHGRTDNRRTDDGQRMITIVHLSLRLRCTKKASARFQMSGFKKIRKNFLWSWICRSLLEQ